MTRPPSHPAPGAPVDDEVLDELGDDAIVAQQAAVHSLQPRAQVDMEARTIVVADEMPEVDPSEVMATRQLPAYTAASDPTAVARRHAARAPTMVLRRVESFAPPKRKNWLVIGIWVAAGVVAFGFGGVLAAITATRSSDSGKTELPVAAPTPAPSPSPTQTAKLEAPARTAPPAPEPAKQEPEAITASDLPVEPVRPPRASKPKKSASTAAPGTAATQAKTAPNESEIPEGI